MRFLCYLWLFFYMSFFDVTYACTKVFWNNNKVANVAARSMDFFTSDQPYLVVYPRGMTRNGQAGVRSLSWKSRYGNVVISAFKSYVATDGMNEHGLIVHLIYLQGHDYPNIESKRPQVSNLMWSQYFLDNHKTVKSALRSLKQFNVVAAPINDHKWTIHLAMEDVTGDAAIIEFVDGKMSVHHGRQYRVATNTPIYQAEVNVLKKYKSFGGKKPLPGDNDPLSRFVRASTYLKTLPAPTSTLDTVAGIFAVIRTVMVPFGAAFLSENDSGTAWPTRWVSIADATHKIYYFNTTKAPNVIWVAFKNLNFSELTHPIAIDPTNMQLNGEVSKFLTKYEF